MNNFIQLVKPIIERFPRIALIYRFIRDSWQINKEPKETKMGFKLIGNPIMQDGNFEPAETRIVLSILPNVDLFINVGANIGYYCCMALSQEKYVVAFEPINLNVQYLLRNIRANGWTSIEVYPIALSNKVGIAEIYGGGTGASLLKGWANIPSQYVRLAPTTTLDNVLETRFKGKKCFILVDIEGAEYLMLQGAFSIIYMNPKPLWMVEISISEHQPNGVAVNPNLSSTFGIFWNAGYEAYTADKQCRMITPKEIEEVIVTGVDTLHTHNFLFVETGKRYEILNF